MNKDEVLDLVLDWLVCYKDKSMSRNNAEELAEELITAIKQVLAKDALYKLAEESCTSGLRLDDWDKIGCVNHDCDKCKAVQEPVAFEDWHSANYVQPLEKYGDSYKNMHVRNRWQGWLGAKSTPPAAQRQWVGLTDEEFEDIELGCRSTSSGKIEAMQKVEAKLRSRNNG